MPTIPQWSDSLHRALAREMLISVRLRSAILLALIAFGVLLFLLATYIPGVIEPALAERFRAIAPLLIGLIGLALGYMAMAMTFITWCLRKGRTPHPAWPYVTSIVEISFTTLTMLGIATRLDSASALASATNIFYLLFVLFSILRMDFFLCAFTGLLAGAQYTAAALYILRLLGNPASTDLAAAPAHHVIVGALYVAAGLVAGFVAVRIKHQIGASIQHLEDRNRIVNLFGQHVSPAVVDKLLSQKLDQTTEVRNVCVMFLDIRDFTPFAEAREPEEVMNYLNQLFGAMIDTINRHHGIVNKFLGDGFMAVFGAPLDDGDNCRHALDASLEILRLLDVMNGSSQIPPTRIGIGLHAGRVITGNLGSSSRREYTIIGSVVNTAARIEQLNKTFDTKLIVSDAVWRACQSHHDSGDAGDLGEIAIKGHHTPMRLFKVA